MPCLSAKPFVPFLFCVSFSTTVAESDLALLVLLILTAELDLLMKISEVNCSPEKRQAWKRPVTVRYKDTAPNLRCPLTPKDVGGLGEQRRGPASWAHVQPQVDTAASHMRGKNTKRSLGSPVPLLLLRCDGHARIWPSSSGTRGVTTVKSFPVCGPSSFTAPIRVFDLVLGLDHTSHWK